MKKIFLISSLLLVSLVTLSHNTSGFIPPGRAQYVNNTNNDEIMRRWIAAVREGRIPLQNIPPAISNSPANTGIPSNIFLNTTDSIPRPIRMGYRPNNNTIVTNDASIILTGLAIDNTQASNGIPANNTAPINNSIPTNSNNNAPNNNGAQPNNAHNSGDQIPEIPRRDEDAEYTRVKIKDMEEWERKYNLYHHTYLQNQERIRQLELELGKSSFTNLFGQGFGLGIITGIKELVGGSIVNGAFMLAARSLQQIVMNDPNISKVTLTNMIFGGPIMQPNGKPVMVPGLFDQYEELIKQCPNSELKKALRAEFDQARINLLKIMTADGHDSAQKISVVEKMQGGIHVLMQMSTLLEKKMGTEQKKELELLLSQKIREQVGEMRLLSNDKTVPTVSNLEVAAYGGAGIGIGAGLLCVIGSAILRQPIVPSTL